MTTLDDDLARRQKRIRQQELLLALAQWGADETVWQITDATGDERAWLQQYVAANGMPRAVDADGDWHEWRRAHGGRANAAATAAFLAGDYAKARESIDEARAFGAVMDAEWRRLHEFIASREGATAPARTTPAAAQAPAEAPHLPAYDAAPRTDEAPGTTRRAAA